MPIYEYECNNCGHQLEAIQKMSDASLVDCPQCSKPALRKLISAVAFRLKGQGWYETDFKEGDKKNLSSNEVADSADKNSDSKKDGKENNKKGSQDGTKAESKAESKKTASDDTGKKKATKSESKSTTKKEKTNSSKARTNK